MTVTLDRNCLWFSQFLPWLSVTTRRETWQKHEKLSNITRCYKDWICPTSSSPSLACLPLSSSHWPVIGLFLQKNRKIINYKVCWPLQASSWETLLVNLNILRWLLIMKYLLKIFCTNLKKIFSANCCKNILNNWVENK